jgi:hypothetical protein
MLLVPDPTDDLERPIKVVNGAELLLDNGRQQGAGESRPGLPGSRVHG